MQYIARVRTVLVCLLLSAPVWANPVVPPPVKAVKVEAKKPEAKKAEPLKLERHVEAKRADAATSTLSLNAPPKKKSAHHVTLPDWQP